MRKDVTFFSRSFHRLRLALRARLAFVSVALNKQKNTPVPQAILVLPNYTKNCENNRNYKICQLYFLSSIYLKNCFSSGSLTTKLRAILFQRVQSYTSCNRYKTLTWYSVHSVMSLRALHNSSATDFVMLTPFRLKESSSGTLLRC